VKYSTQYYCTVSNIIFVANVLQTVLLFIDMLLSDVTDSLPYSLPCVEPGADPGVQSVSLQVTISHPPPVGCHYFLSGLCFSHKRSPDGTTLTELTDCSPILVRPRADPGILAVSLQVTY